MKAYLKNYRMSPRKVRLVGDAVKGKNIAQADVVLSFMPKKAARIIQTLIRSAVSNAITNEGKQKETLFVKTVEINKGVTLKRFRARARGSASPINKRTSNITVELFEKDITLAQDKKAKGAKAKTTKPTTQETKKPSEATKKVDPKTTRKIRSAEETNSNQN